MSENNDNSSESNSVGSDTFFQNSRVTRGVTNSILRQSVLRPSVLDTAVQNTPSNVLGGAEAMKTSSNETEKNPFNKEYDENDAPDKDAAEVAAKDADKSDEDDTKKENKDSTADDEIDERPDPMTMLRKNGLERCNIFAASKNSIPRVETSGFVFGENVHERVVGENLHVDGNAKTEANVNGTTMVKGSEMLFSSVIENAAKSNDLNSEGAACTAIAKENEAKSLTDVVREYEESRGAQKRKYEEVETFTGEENEINIVDINCKLFAFVNSNWEERGRGSLRLNSSNESDDVSRVVFRTSGNLRLIINTKVWAGMVAERPSQKSLRLTAMDSTGKIKIFLVMGRPADIKQLHTALKERINLRKTTHPYENQSHQEEDGHENGNNNEKSATKKNGSVTDEASSAAAMDDVVADDSESEISTTEKDGEIDEVIDEKGAGDSNKPKDDVELAEPSPKKKLVETDGGQTS